MHTRRGCMCKRRGAEGTADDDGGAAAESAAPPLAFYERALEARVAQMAAHASAPPGRAGVARYAYPPRLHAAGPRRLCIYICILGLL